MNYVAAQEVAPNIVFSISSNPDGNILVYDDVTTVDFDFDEKCIPLLTYMVLSKLGVEIREQMLLEYSQLGIAKESVRP
jgi:alanine-alpha-ketoisovalerate/valine-pyruvate aminotransferase